MDRDQQNRLHSESGPAVVYAGNFQIYSWRNTRINSEAIETPASLQAIVRARNLETMRVLIERYGIEEFLKDSGAKHVHEDETGVLYSFRDPDNWGSADSIKIVAVKNATPEIDGTFKQYFLRVPPNMRSAREAVAWTFNMTPAEYRPIVES